LVSAQHVFVLKIVSF